MKLSNRCGVIITLAMSLLSISGSGIQSFGECSKGGFSKAD